MDRLVATVRSGRSQVLVLRGEAGVGKTALLLYVAQSAPGFRVVRAVGVESEMELAFAGLHQLCAPLLDGRDALPHPQRDALNVAFGLCAGSAPDRFVVGLAVLNLMAAAAREQPLLCLIDDVQWLDRVSAQTLAFVARRLLAESVAVIFAVRDGGNQELDGLSELPVAGLRRGAARALLDSVIPGLLDERVRDRIVAETRGNPLALLELPKDLTAAELAGGYGLPDARPLDGQIEESFLRRVKALPMQTQRLLFAAAAETVGDTSLLMRATERLGIPDDAITPAEAEGLIDVGARVRFRHPLVRSAAYRAADLVQRREVHDALAAVTDPDTDPDRRAWHRANAAAGPDEVVAAELERSAGRAQARGGIAAAAAFLQRATELTSDPVRRGARALAAAQAKREAAALDGAYDLLEIAETAPLDDLQRARLARLRAQIVFARSHGGGDVSMTVSETAAGLLRAAKGLETLDDELARETYLEAMGAAMHGGRLCPLGGAVEVARPARMAPPGPQPARPIDLLLDGLSMRVTTGAAASQATLRRALALTRSELEQGGADVMRWLWLAFPVAQESAVHELWDDEMWHQLATHAVRLARDAGALAILPVALVYRAGVHVQAGELAAAGELIEEADAIAAATGQAPGNYHALALAAWRGDKSEATRLIDAAAADATARGDGRLLSLTSYASALLNNGLGRHDLALTAAEQACSHEDLGLFGWCLVEYIEAAVRCGETATALKALALLEERTTPSETDWARGMVARSRALLAEDEVAEELYREAIDRLGGTRIAVHHARACLLYGEWLRHCGRRTDARAQLHTAYESFVQLGARAFAERARRELASAGEKVRKRTAASDVRLTVQEAQIARLAGEGLTNAEIAAQLFISTHTVDWHLRKVFAKLGIASRRQLRGTTIPPGTSDRSGPAGAGQLT
ncbi:AAA family ATPase [Mycobacterium sp. 21AC1]|nr:AAA family ATPase [Mycobacterium sp. 21AC1]